ncbi:MAG: hypothetical protein ACI4J4_05615 [Ruminiclostridium sp.]
MKTEKRKNSALKKLIPAVAMLATSAVMLSTATYAWFTMNKEVKMTGLNMTATVGEGIEIALASVTGDGNAITLKNDTGSTYVGEHPADTDTEKGWKSAVAVNDYYADIGKIKPASSVNATALFDATDASNGGRTASTFKALTLPDDMAQIQKRATLPTTSGSQIIESTGTVGYYVDIPVHIRTSKVKDSETEGDLYCKMIINNNGATGDTKTLYKAVRVAFIPITTGTSSTTNIFGADKEYYEAGKAVDSTTSKGAVTVLSGATDFVTDGTDFIDGVGVVSGLKLPYAENAGEYGHLDFYVRVWLEGESTSCYDDKAGQEWNISIAFSLGEFETPTP